MNQKGFVNIVVIIGIIILAGAVGYFIVNRQTQKPPTPVIERISLTEAPIGAEISIIGFGFTSTKNSLQFGTGFAYLNNLVSSDEKTITFTLPESFDTCNPDGGVCAELLSRPIPGQMYEVAVININGRSNFVNFAVAREEVAPAPTPTPTPTPSSTPPPARKIDLRSSLLAVTNRHLNDAEAIAAGVKLFEVETSISPEEIDAGNILIQHVFSSFVLPNEDVKYIRVNEWFENQAKRNYATSSGNFIVLICSGGPPPPPEFGCGQPTGESEPRERHLPISNWTMDSQALGRILKENGMGSSRGGKIVVTSIGRLKSKYSEFFPQSIAQLPDGQTVIEFIEVGIGGASTNFGEVGQYLILDAKDGKIIAKGNYSLPPPPQ